MTFKDLQRLIGSQPDFSPSSNSVFAKLRNKPFWSWDSTVHREKNRISKNYCCFNHIIGLPKKDGKELPLFPYEKMVYLSLMEPEYLNSRTGTHGVAHSFKEKHLWVKKSTGLGITEFLLRFMAWLCLRNDDYRNSQMIIVTGPNLDLATKLIKRMKGLFAELDVTFANKETVLELNNCSIEAYPSHHIDSARSLTNPKFIFIDEADYIPKFQQEDIRLVSERYIAKSNPYICMVSTPSNPGNLFEAIEHESFETCIYKKLFLDYTYGLDKIYTREEIEKAKASPSFQREYMLQYSGLLGNVFSHQSIADCQKLGEKYNPENINPRAKKSVGLDPGFGSSNFAIVATQFVDGRIQIIEASEFKRPSFSDMISKVWELKQRCHYISNIFVDASNPEIIEALKREFGESTDWHYIHEQILECRKFNMPIEDRMLVVPTPFSVEGRRMLQHAKFLLEETEPDGNGEESSLIAIHPKFDKLLTALRSAIATEYKLSKEQTAFNDLLDGFLLALQFYKRVK